MNRAASNISKNASDYLLIRAAKQSKLVCFLELVSLTSPITSPKTENTMNRLAIVLIGLAIIGFASGNWRHSESFVEWLKRREPSRVLTPNEYVRRTSCQCSSKYAEGKSGIKLGSSCKPGYKRCADAFADGRTCCRKA
ncbi:hypothetical protein ACROYT_G031805 [Oculina patagonica]